MLASSLHLYLCDYSIQPIAVADYGVELHNGLNFLHLGQNAKANQFVNHAIGRFPIIIGLRRKQSVDIGLHDHDRLQAGTIPVRNIALHASTYIAMLACLLSEGRCDVSHRDCCQAGNQTTIRIRATMAAAIITFSGW